MIQGKSESLEGASPGLKMPASQAGALSRIHVSFASFQMGANWIANRASKI
jgi:hypothetical protein